MTDARHMIETLADALRMARDEIIELMDNELGMSERQIKREFEEEDHLKAIDAAIAQADAFLGVEYRVA
jgi:hypothetical protein